jgi:hypothetical protein
LLGGEFRAVDRKSAGAGLALQQRRDLPDGFAAAAFACDDSGKLREALGLSQHQSGERQRDRGNGCVHGQSGKAVQHLAEVAPLKDWYVGRRPDPLNNPTKDCVKQRRLIWETIIERSLGNCGTLRDSLNAGGAVAFGQKQIGRDIKNTIPEKSSLLAGRAAAPPSGLRLGGFGCDTTSTQHTNRSGELKLPRFRGVFDGFIDYGSVVTTSIMAS